MALLGSNVAEVEDDKYEGTVRPVTPNDVMSVLLWIDRPRSARIFFAGLYLLICWRTMVLSTSMYIQPLTVVAGTCLIAMLTGLSRHVLHVVAARLRMLGFVVFLGVQIEEDMKSDEMVAREQQLRVQMQVSNTLSKVGTYVASGAGAVAGLIWYHLHSAKKAGLMCIAMYLWFILLLSETRMIS